MFSCIIQTKCAQIKRGDPQEMGIWGEMAGPKMEWRRAGRRRGATVVRLRRGCGGEVVVIPALVMCGPVGIVVLRLSSGGDV